MSLLHNVFTRSICYRIKRRPFFTDPPASFAIHSIGIFEDIHCEELLR